MRLEGVITALITPFRGGEVDHDALADLVKFQVEQGVHGLVACGTTGEGATLTEQEWAEVLRTVVRVAGGKVPVLAGTGTNSTPTTVRRTRAAKDLGADAALVVTPYYNRPQQEGLFAHFKRVAEEGGLPVVLYNVPSRTGVNLAPETTLRLAQVAGIVGVKEASGSVAACREVISGAKEGFVLLSGDDGLWLPLLAIGARGVVSVASNLAPREMVLLFEAFLRGDMAQAAAIDRKLGPLYQALFVETNPVPVKVGAALLGLCTDEVRPPLAQATQRTREAVEQALRLAGVLRL